MEKLKNREAFTLIELLFVLSLISIIVFISVPIVHHIREQLEIDQFFKIFEADVRYIQNQSLGGSNSIYITLYHDAYTVSELTKDVYTREYPSNMHTKTNREIVFNRRGTIKDPTTIRFYLEDGTVYKAVFPFGKGRHYIEKQ